MLFRKALPWAGICAAVLFCQLTGTVTRYDHQLMKLRSDSSVRGFLTDIRGQSTSGLALGDGVVEGISQIPGVADVTYLTTAPYYFNGFYRDCKVVDADQPTLSQARLLLSQAARTALARVLTLMGMNTPESM